MTRHTQLALCLVIVSTLAACGGTIRTWPSGKHQPANTYSVLLMGETALRKAPLAAKSMRALHEKIGVAYMVNVTDSAGSADSEDNFLGLIKERYELLPGPIELRVRCFLDPQGGYLSKSQVDPGSVLSTTFTAERGRTYAAFCGHSTDVGLTWMHEHSPQILERVDANFAIEVADVTDETE